MEDKHNRILEVLTSSMFVNSKNKQSLEINNDESIINSISISQANPILFKRLLNRYENDSVRSRGDIDITFPMYYLSCQRSTIDSRHGKGYDRFIHVILDEKAKKYTTDMPDPFELYDLIIDNSSSPFTLDVEVHPESYVVIPSIISRSIFDLSANYFFFMDQNYQLSPLDIFILFDAPLISSISNFCKDHEKCSNYEKCCYPDHCSELEICKKNFPYTLRTDSDIAYYFDDKIKRNVDSQWGIETKRDKRHDPLKINILSSGFWSARLSLYDRFTLRTRHPDKGINSIKFQTRLIQKPQYDGDKKLIEPIDLLSFTPQDSWYYELCTGVSFCSRIAAFIKSLDSNASKLTEFWINNREDIFVQILSLNKDIIINCPAHKWRISVVENIIYSFNQHCIKYLTNSPNSRLNKDLQICFYIMKHNSSLSKDKDKIIRILVDFGSSYFKSAFKIYYHNLHIHDPNDEQLLNNLECLLTESKYNQLSSKEQANIKSDYLISYIKSSHYSCQCWYQPYLKQSIIADILVNECDSFLNRLDKIFNTSLLIDAIQIVYLNRRSFIDIKHLSPLNKQFVARYFLAFYFATCLDINNGFPCVPINLEPLFDYLSQFDELTDLTDSDLENVKHEIEQSLHSIEMKVSNELFSEQYFLSFDSFLHKYLKSIFNSQKYLMFCEDKVISNSYNLHGNISTFLRLDIEENRDYISDLKDGKNPSYILFRKIHSKLYPNGYIDFDF